MLPTSTIGCSTTSAPTVAAIVKLVRLLGNDDLALDANAVGNMMLGCACAERFARFMLHLFAVNKSLARAQLGLSQSHKFAMGIPLDIGTYQNRIMKVLDIVPVGAFRRSTCGQRR